MAAPTLAKTWQHTYSGGHSTNVRLLSSAVLLTDNQTLMKRIKDILIGYTNVPWTVRYSSDGTAAGAAGDGVDRWSTIAKLVWATAGSNHSWIVLRQTGIGATAEICIDLSNGSSQNATVVFSPGGFSSGSLTARPTAADEMVLLSNANWGSGSGAAFTCVLSVMQTSDGQCTRLFFFRAGLLEAAWLFEKPAAAVTGWSTPFFGLVSGGAAAAVLTYSNLITGTGLGHVRISSTNGVAQITTEDYGTSTLQEGQRQTVYADMPGTSGPTFTPAGIVVPTSVGARGRHGYFSDLWVAPSYMRTGDTLPNDNTRVLMVAGCLLVPWNGEAPRIN